MYLHIVSLIQSWNIYIYKSILKRLNTFPDCTKQTVPCKSQAFKKFSDEECGNHQLCSHCYTHANGVAAKRLFNRLRFLSLKFMERTKGWFHMQLFEWI